MALELKVPSMGESITEVQIGDWLKSEGAALARDENVVTIESEKATVELATPAAGLLAKILKPKGANAKVGEVIAYIEAEVAGSGAPAAAVAPAPAPASTAPTRSGRTATVMPAAQRLATETGIPVESVAGTGPGGRVLKEDVAAARAPLPAAPVAPAAAPAVAPAPPAGPSPAPTGVDTSDEIVPMSPMRRTIARRLVEAQANAALLTTFNEVDLLAVTSLRKEFGDEFQKKYGVKLGFMSFFVKAAVDALKAIPAVNAEIRDQNIVYHHTYDIGVAVGGGKGLVVPVIRNADQLGFAELEKTIGELGRRAKDNKLKPEELRGGTFTISNGGIYGSLLSTPIVNPPQSGILGMHTIQDRPVAREGQVVIRPMMYIALTYDHRLVDGREAVTFLKRIKDVLETPARLFLEI